MKTLLILAVAANVALAAVTPLTEARTVKQGENEIVQIACAVNVATVIVLREESMIVQPVLGDGEDWTMKAIGPNAVYVKPTTRAKGSTNVTLVGRSGRHYAYIATLSDSPDVMVYVEPKENGVVGFRQGKLYTEDEVGVYQKQLAEMNLQVQKIQESVALVRQDADKKLAVAKAELPKKISHPYRFERDKAPFNVRAMYHDGRFTYIEASSQEAPAVYEEKDGKPKIVQYSFEDGKYVVDKVLANGHFSIGKEKMPFYTR